MTDRTTGDRPDEREPTLADVMADDPDTPVTSTIPLPALATRNLVAHFSTIEEGRDALLRLEKAGIDGARLGFLALDRTDHEPTAEEQSPDDEEQGRKIVGRTAAGGAAGTGIGALAAAGVAALIPGIGPVLGAGVLGAAIGGGAAGGALGGIWAGFTGMGASRAWEETFAHVKEGRAVVGVHSDDTDEIAKAIEVLRETPAGGLRVIDDQGETVSTAG